MFTVGSLVKTPYVRVTDGDFYTELGVIIKKENEYGTLERYVLWQDKMVEKLSLYRNPEGYREYCLDKVLQKMNPKKGSDIRTYIGDALIVVLMGGLFYIALAIL